MFEPESNVQRALSARSRYLNAPARVAVLAVFLAVALLAQGLPSALTPSQLHADASNPIQIENQQPGDPTWDDFATVASQDAISGYASPISINHGQPVDFYVTTTAASFTIKVYRMGWYGGVGARLMTSLGTFPGVHQAIPAPDPVTGMVSCDGKWQKTTTLSVPSTWTTGVYLAKLTASNGNKSFIFFVVRDDGGAEPIEFQTSVTTYQAYNAWGGVSLYTNNTNGSVYKYAHATKVSFDRPFDPLDGNGSGHFLAYEYPFIRWAESQGENLTYITDVDTQTNVNPLVNHKVFLSVGHDEYWSKGMRTNVQNAIDAGVNVAFFSANTDYWQIRFEPNADGVANRVEVGYKDTATFDALPGPDPQWGVNNAIVTTRWRDDPVNLPENALIGVMYQDQVNKDYAYVVQNASNWIYTGTGFVNGSSVPGIVGYEYDKIWNNGFSPPGLIMLSNSPVVGCCEGSGNSDANSSLYTAASGAQVFAAGTIQWSWGLDNYSSPANYVNAGIQRTTANILANFTSGSIATAPAVSMSPASLTFSGQPTGTTSASQIVTLTNSGTAALTISSVALTGTNSADFVQSNTCPISPSTLDVNATCTFSVTFSPSATGARTAGISISDTAGDSPQGIALTGTGTAPAPVVSLSPSNLSFGNQVTGTVSSAQTVTLTNNGNADLTIGGIGIAGTNSGDFAQTNTCPSGPTTLLAGANCTISVTFSPGATGPRTAALSITDDAAGSPQSIALTGTGTAPSVTLNPASLTFASQVVGTASAPQSVTLTNSGTASLIVSSIGLTGANATDFAQTTTCPMAPNGLSAGSKCTISVTFTPAATGSRAASVTVTDNAADSPESVSLSGTGITSLPAVSLVGSSTASGNFGIGIKLKVPAAAVAGDLLVVTVGTNGAPSKWTPPVGWTAGANSAHPSGQGLNWWWKVATASDAAATVTFKSSGYADGGGELLDYRGLSRSSPILAVSTMATNNNGGSGNVTTPTFNGVSWSGAANVVSLLLVSWQPNPATITWRNGFALQATANDGFDFVAAGANLVPVSTVSLPAQTATLSRSSDVVPTLQVALRVGP